MLAVEKPDDLKNHIGEDIGVSDWLKITQSMINDFANATGDHQWIHVDEEKAAKEFPGGKTIAHGFLSLSLVPRFLPEIFEVKKESAVINYGCNKVRFISPVPRDSEIRLRLSIKDVQETKDGGYKMFNDGVIELKDSEKPAAAFELITIHYP